MLSSARRGWWLRSIRPLAERQERNSSTNSQKQASAADVTEAAV
jgi:hypothetical protein